MLQRSPQNVHRHEERSDGTGNRADPAVERDGSIERV